MIKFNTNKSQQILPDFIYFKDNIKISKCHYLDNERAKDLIAF